MNKRKDTKYIAVHCMATTAKQDFGSVWVDTEHRKRGFAKCGYHAVIRRDGTLETQEKGFPCRSWDEIGAHVEGFNSVSVGICMAGGLKPDAKTPIDNFTKEQYATLAALLRDLKVKYPQAVIQGHRDFPNVAKACPCFDVKPWVEKNSI